MTKFTSLEQIEAEVRCRIKRRHRENPDHYDLTVYAQGVVAEVAADVVLPVEQSIRSADADAPEGGPLLAKVRTAIREHIVSVARRQVDDLAWGLDEEDNDQ